MAKRSTCTALMVVVMLWMAPSCVAEHKAEDEYDTLKDIKEKAKSWSNWASDKSSNVFGRVLQESHESKESQEVKETLGEAASTATDTMNSAGLGTSKYALGKASRVLSEAEEFGSFGLDKTNDGYNEFKRRINLAKNEDSDDDGDDDDDDHGDNGLREMVGEDKNNEAKKKEQELKNLAEESSSEDAKSSYEVAKEKVSQAAGDLGAMVRGKIEEL